MTMKHAKYGKESSQNNYPNKSKQWHDASCVCLIMPNELKTCAYRPITDWNPFTEIVRDSGASASMTNGGSASFGTLATLNELRFVTTTEEAT